MQLIKNSIIDLYNYVIKNVNVFDIVFIIFFILILIWLRYINIRRQYSNEGWKIRKKNGKKSIFWYDENGKKVYKKPKKSNPPSRYKRGL